MGYSKVGDGFLYAEGIAPYIQLKDTTPSTGLNLSLKNVGGIVYVYNVDTDEIIAPLYPRPDIIIAEHRPTNPSTGAAETATLTWKETIFACPPGASFEVIGVGFMPNAAFGQATNYATLSCVNKGTNGAGTTVIASRAFNSAATVNAMNSLGTLSNPSISENQTLTVEKTVTSSGQIVPAGAHYLFLRRTA